MRRSSKNAYLSRQHIKDDQINFLLGGVEKKLEEYRNALEQKENNFQTQKKYLFLQNKVTIKQLLKIRNLKHILRA